MFFIPIMELYPENEFVDIQILYGDSVWKKF